MSLKSCLTAVTFEFDKALNASVLVKHGWSNL